MSSEYLKEGMTKEVIAAVEEIFEDFKKIVAEYEEVMRHLRGLLHIFTKAEPELDRTGI